MERIRKKNKTTIKLCLKNSMSYHKINCLKKIYFLSIFAMFWNI